MPSSRRRFLAGLAAGCTGTVGGCAELRYSESAFSPGTAETTEWRYPDYDRYSTAYSRDAAAPRNGVSKRWSATIPWPRGRPVVADGRVFASTMENLVALDLDSGEKLWSFSASDHSWTAPPTVRDGTVYVGAGDERGLWALDAATGKAEWSVETRGPVKAAVLPSHTGDRLYAGDATGRVCVLGLDGSVAKTRNVLGPVASLCAGRSTVVVGTKGGHVYEFYQDGEAFYPLWGRRVAGGVQDVAVVDGGSVVVSVFGDYVYKLRNGAHAGSNRWRAEFTANDFVAAKTDVVGTNLSTLTSLNASDGDPRWSRSGKYVAGPAAAGDRFYVGGEYDGDSNGGYLAAYPLGKGGKLLGGEPERAWKRELPGTPVGGLTVADGALLTVTKRQDGDDNLYVFDPA
ncbi:PQQ-binding-like beta-propeller repeat protein (plasmid) [Halorussus limi]|uniref:PQQ-binding-like beta-propeller repeat protein n=1 Tax=Halorussus limi TaxID=2938695 RepID=A0A8U0I0U5_9EURY|nr:PQQ-binding-like beta-propeller repeat protein [Halorussus limi]UPV76526.1 PQQ-binding-like beta-propeller repeat protein [Halorussus limi]